MKKKIIILYDLKEKSNGKRTRIIQKLYAHQEKSNYVYAYQRTGLLSGFDIEKSRKTALLVKNKNDLAKISEILRQLKVKFEVVQG
ncbi:MAG: hypothetical protein AAB972_01065 [Patescibacteria group bacterium]